MSQITLLECREAAAAQNNANGDWQTVLNAPQLLMPGDEVLLKTAALDTRKEGTGTITLENDVSASISGYPYVVNYIADDKDYFSSPDRDYKRYYASKLMGNPGASPYKLLTSITVRGVEPSDKIDKCTITATFPGPPTTKIDTIVKTTAAPVAANSQLPVVSDKGVSALATGNGILFIQSTKAETATFVINGKLKIHGSAGTNTQENIVGTDMKPGIPTFSTQQWYEIVSITVLNAPTAGSITVGTMSADVPNTTAPIAIPQLKGYGKHVVPCALHVATTVVASDIKISNIPFNPARNNPIKPAINKFEVDNFLFGPETITDDYFEPRELSHDFVIPAGTYSPTTLCSFINTSITLNRAESTGGAALLVNDMMKASTYLSDIDTLWMLREDDSDAPTGFTFSSNDGNGLGSWIGCSTIQLGFNSNTNCFEWQYLHTPLYDFQSANATGDPAIVYEQQGSQFFSTSAMMGIALTSMTPSTFWRNRLGFDTVFASYTNGSTPRSVGNFVSTRFPTFNVSIGANTTANFVGTDTVVQKKNTSNKVPTITSGTKLTTTSDLDNFLPVKATTAYTTLAKDTTGYFLIDVQTNFKTEIIGSSDTSRTIQAVVGRFYNTGSYTIAGSDSGIMYQHVGAPQMFQSLSIRILHPDGTLADDVGNDSTLYFEIQRALPQSGKQ